MSSLSGIVLCGGLSRRMGIDKAWLPWNGETFLSRAVEILRPLVKEVIVVARPGQDLPVTSACVVRDRILGAGPLGGLEAGLAAMGTHHGMVVACDMPGLNPRLLKAMAALAPDWDLVIPHAFGSYQPLHAIYAKSVQPVVAGLLARGELRIHALVDRVKTRVLDELFIRTCDPSGRSVRGLDNWEAYQEARAYS